MAFLWSLWPLNLNRWLFQLKLLHMIHISWKNYEILKFWVLDFGFGLQNFFGLSKFFWDLWCLRSPVPCKNHMFEEYFMPNSFWCRYYIPVHCVEAIISETVIFQAAQNQSFRPLVVIETFYRRSGPRQTWQELLSFFHLSIPPHRPRNAALTQLLWYSNVTWMERYSWW